jgi:hypothetical protein
LKLQSRQSAWRRREKRWNKRRDRDRVALLVEEEEGRVRQDGKVVDMMSKKRS